MNKVISKVNLGKSVRVLDTPLKSIAEFETWRYSVLYMLRLDSEMKVFLDEGFFFGPKDEDHPHRSLKNDEGYPKEEGSQSAAGKCQIIDFILDTICQFLPCIPHNDIALDCGSLNEVWQVVRLHSNIQTSGALLNDVWNVARLPNETPQQLYSRMKQAYDDNLIRANTLEYKGKVLLKDEKMSPTLHCTVILHWMQVLHPRLRDHVTQKFCTELRNVTYADLWPEISRNVDRFIKELQDDHEGAVCRIGDNSRYGDNPRYGTNFRPQRSQGSYSRFRGPPRSTLPNSSYSNFKSCDYCRVTGRKSYKTHSIDDCLFLKKERRDTEGFSRAVEEEEDEHLTEFYEAYPAEFNQIRHDHVINQVNVNSSPVLTLFRNNKAYDITLDSGGTCSVIDSDTAEELSCEVRSTLQGARLGDGKTKLQVRGETDVTFNRHGKVYSLNALVADMAEPTILGGIPFFIANDISIRPATSEICLNISQEVIKYKPNQITSNKFRRLQSFTVRSSSDAVILPGEEIVFQVPKYLHQGKAVAVEPRYDNSHNHSYTDVWPAPRVHEVVEGELKLINTTKSPILIKRNEHVCNLQTPMYGTEEVDVSHEPYPSASVSQVKPTKKISNYSDPVQVNPDKIISEEDTKKFISLLHVYDEVFNPEISKYNGKKGPCYVEVNMGSQPPPQNKGRVPNYGRGDMLELQQKMDELVRKGVFRRPQEIGVTVENVNPSFMVKKRPPSVDKRLVTDFTQIASYCRPTPTVMPDVESTLRQIATWKVMMKTDLKEAYWQIELKRSSMKYCGVVSPMKGVLVYTVGCMGLPGTEVALEELTCLLFGHLVAQGKVAKLADDMFLGGETVEEVLATFEEVLQILLECNLKLSAKKTIICPKSTEILGWIWSAGYLRAGSHRLSALAECEPPQTAKALKSFIGAYRFLSRVIKDYASLLLPLEMMITGKVPLNTKLQWSDSQLQALKKAQGALKDTKSVVIPKPDDQLQIVTDAALTPTAVGAVMYAIRDGKALLAGYYNTKLPVFQRRWLPCEIEGVAIGLALNHFSPYLIHSHHKPIILTDSKPCIQAIEKLNRGQYSASARLCTFLSSVARYQAIVKHIQGQKNTLSDFISRNPVPCNEVKCQICSFAKSSMESVVAAVTVEEVISGKVNLPFTNKKAWKEIQEECYDLKNVFKYLRNGTKPGKKGRNLRTIKRYISSKVVISAEGTLVVRQVEPYCQSSERIVVPAQVLHGLLTVLHLRLEHPTASNLTKVFNRYFFALNLEGAIAISTQSCHQCSSLREFPSAMKKQSTDLPPEHFAQMFAADVLKRNSQLIMVLRECTSSYTQTELIESEQAKDIADSLVRLSNLVRPSKLIPIIIRLDPHASHKSLFQQIQAKKEFASHNIIIELGRALNENKNPVGEKAVRELIRELLFLRPEGGKVSATELSQATAVLNSRIRSAGVSAYEIFTQRDQNSGLQLDIDDMKLIKEQQERRVGNHLHSQRSKSSKALRPEASVAVGDIVYLYDDKSKLSARSRYIVISIDGDCCNIKKFTRQYLGASTYTVKLRDCFVVQEELSDVDLPPYPRSEVDDGTVIISEGKQKQEVDITEKDVITVDEVADQDVSEQEEGGDPCTTCNVEIEGEDKALTCDTCQQWCHIHCGGVSQEVYQMLLEEEEVRWMCPSCIKRASDPGTVPHTAHTDVQPVRD